MIPTCPTPSIPIRVSTAFLLSFGPLACANDVTQPPEPLNRAPQPVGIIAAQTLHKGDTATLDLASHFTDPDGDTLAYAATTSNAEVAIASTEGSAPLITAASQGSATITVTATDPGGLSASQAFEVTVPNRAPAVTDSIQTVELFTGDSLAVDLAAHLS